MKLVIIIHDHSFLEYSLLQQILSSIPPSTQLYSPPSFLTQLSTTSISCLSQFNQLHTFFHSSLQSNRTTSIKESILHISSFFSSRSYDEQILLLSTIERFLSFRYFLINSSCLNHFSSFEGTEERFLQQLLCSHSSSLASYQLHASIPTDINSIIQFITFLYDQPSFQPHDLFIIQQVFIYSHIHYLVITLPLS